MRSSPGRSGVTYDAVIAAADAIVAGGGRATLRRVRESLGTGSLGTIQKHLSSWQENRQPLEAPRVSLSSELQRALLDEIGRNVVSARDEALLELEEIKAARDDLAEELERQVGVLETTAATQAGVIEQLRTEANLTAERVAGLTRELAGADLQLRQLPALQDEIANIRGKLLAETSLRLAAEGRVALLEQAVIQHEAVRLQLEARVVELQESQRLLSQMLGKNKPVRSKRA